MEFWRYYRIIRKRRWLIILGMLICVGAVEINNLRMEPEYTGRTTLMEPMGMSREGVPLYPQQNMQLDMQLRLSNLGNIARSQRVIVPAVDTLADLGMEFSPDRILQNTSIQPVRDTNILAVEVTLPNPYDAKNAADVIAAEFKRVYGELNNSAVRQSREFIEAQLETTRKAMIKSQDELKRYKQANGVVELNHQSMLAIQRLSQAKVDLNSLTAHHEAAKARRGKIEQELDQMQQWQVSGQQTSRDPVWQYLSQQLVELETRKAGMTNAAPGQPYRKPSHPDVLAIQRQIDEIIEKRKSTEPEYISNTTESQNPNYMNAFDRWVTAKTEEVATNAQRLAMDSVVGKLEQELTVLPEKEARLAELMMNVKIATDTYGLMRSKVEEAKITEQQAKNSVSLKTIDPAYVYPVNQKKSTRLVMAFLLSPILGIGIAFLLHYTDNTVKTAQEAEKILGLPVMAVVPGARAHSLPRQNCPEVMNIAYQMLTSNLWIASQNQGVNSVAMVSAEPDAGRSVTASNLAVSLARDGARVVLVDADLRKPTQHLIFGVDNKVGLTNLLSGGCTVEDVLVPTKVQGLLMVPTGPVPDNPVKLLRSAEMSEFANQIKEVADFVIYDTPAGVAFPDPVLTAAQVGSAVVVQSAGRVPRGSEAELNSRLESVGVRLMGVVLNKVKREDSSGYFHYHRSYQGVNLAQLPGGKKSMS